MHSLPAESRAHFAGSRAGNALSPRLSAAGSAGSCRDLVRPRFVVVAPRIRSRLIRIRGIGLTACGQSSLERRTARLQIYLPIADLPVNLFVILAMGLAVGFISGMFGIGGGFLMTPLLIFLGISPAVAVATVASHIAASSMSGAINYWR